MEFPGRVMLGAVKGIASLASAFRLPELAADLQVMEDSHSFQLVSQSHK